MSKMIQPGLVYDTDLEGGPLSEERRAVLAHVGRDKTVLEIGAHTGYFSAQLRRHGCRVSAVEMDPGAAEKARRCADDVVVGDIESPDVLARIGSGYDVVLLMHILEHLVDPWRVLRELGTRLRPGGVAIVLLPNVAGWRVRKDLFFKGAFEYTGVGTLDRTHLRFFTLHTARAFLTDSGYDVVSWAPIDVCVPLERRLRRMPIIGALSRPWKAWMTRRFPNLCAEILLFVAAPRRASAGPSPESAGGRH
jgi:SAM-dependent methyltransferase